MAEAGADVGKEGFEPFSVVCDMVILWGFPLQEGRSSTNTW